MTTSESDMDPFQYFLITEEKHPFVDFERIVSLASIALRLNHPNLLRYVKIVHYPHTKNDQGKVQPICVCEEDSDRSIQTLLSSPLSTVICTEKMDHFINLSQYLLSKPNRTLPEIESMVIFQQIVSALHCLHSSHVVHGNLNLESVFVSRESSDQGIQVKLGDFIVTNKKGPFFRSSLSKNSYQFFAPEVWLADEKKPVPQLKPESDIWSVGVIFYMMNCGCYPFFGSDELDIFMSITKGQLIEPSPQLPIEIRTMIRAMLLLKPEERATLEELSNPHLLVSQFGTVSSSSPTSPHVETPRKQATNNESPPTDSPTGAEPRDNSLETDSKKVIRRSSIGHPILFAGNSPSMPSPMITSPKNISSSPMRCGSPSTGLFQNDRPEPVFSSYSANSTSSHSPLQQCSPTSTSSQSSPVFVENTQLRIQTSRMSEEEEQRRRASRTRQWSKDLIVDKVIETFMAHKASGHFDLASPLFGSSDNRSKSISVIPSCVSVPSPESGLLRRLSVDMSKIPTLKNAGTDPPGGAFQGFDSQPASDHQHSHHHPTLPQLAQKRRKSFSFTTGNCISPSEPNQALSLTCLPPGGQSTVIFPSHMQPLDSQLHQMQERLIQQSQQTHQHQLEERYQMQLKEHRQQQTYKTILSARPRSHSIAPLLRHSSDAGTTLTRGMNQSPIIQNKTTGRFQTPPALQHLPQMHQYSNYQASNQLHLSATVHLAGTSQNQFQSASTAATPAKYNNYVQHSYAPLPNQPHFHHHQHSNATTIDRGSSYGPGNSMANQSFNRDGGGHYLPLHSDNSISGSDTSSDGDTSRYDMLSCELTPEELGYLDLWTDPNSLDVSSEASNTSDSESSFNNATAVLDSYINYCFL